MREAILDGLCPAPAGLPAIPAAHEQDESDALNAWMESVAELARAEWRIEAFARRTGGKARPFEAQCRVDERYSDLVCAFNRRVEGLMLAPAPDINAFARKIALLVDEQAWELPAGEACLARVKADAEEMAAAYG